MNPLPNDVIELQRELYLCVNLILRVAGPIEGNTPHAVVEKFVEMYQQEYRANPNRPRILADGSPIPYTVYQR